MKNRLRHTLVVLLLLVLGGTALLVGWLGWSEAGARWLLELAGDRLPGRLRIERIEGSLAGSLTLQGVAWSTPGVSLATSDLVLQWQPAGLLRGRIVVNRLAIARIDILQQPSENAGSAVAAPAPGPAWPNIPGWAAMLRVQIERLQVAGIRYQAPGAPGFEIGACGGRLRLLDGNLNWEELEVNLRQGRLAGAAILGSQPRMASARLHFQASDPGSLGGVSAADLEVDLNPGHGENWAVGKMRLQLDWPPEPLVHLAGTLTIKTAGLELSALRLNRQDVAGDAEGWCRLDWSAEDPVLNLDLQLHDVDLMPEANLRTALSGRLQGQVDSSGYRGMFDLANSSEGWKGLALRGDYHGDGDGIVLESLAGAWLAGDVTGNLRIYWRNQVRLLGELAGRNLDPARLAGTWPGSINLDLSGDMHFPTAAPFQASWDARILPSRLLDRTVSGSVRGRYDEQGLALDPLNLAGDGTRLHAEGVVSERLRFAMTSRDLGGMVPGAGGSLKASGWVRHLPGDGWSGQGTASGADLRWGPVTADRLELSGGRGGAGAPFDLRWTGKDLGYGPLRVSQVEGRLQGTLAEHHLAVRAQQPQGALDAEATGGVKAGGWNGTLLDLSFHDRARGDLKLVAPVRIEAGPRRLDWGQLRLAGGRQESLSCEGQLELPDLSGRIGGAWDRLDLARFSGWLQEGTLGGSSSGRLDVEWGGGRLVNIGGELTAAGHWQTGKRALEVRGIATRFQWGNQGLEGDGRIDLGDLGSGSFTLRSGDGARLDLPDRGEIEGHWQDLELGLLNPWLSGVALEGRSFGRGHLRWQADGPAQFVLDAGSGALRVQANEELQLAGTELHLTWNGQGLDAELGVQLAGGGRLQGRLRSPEPAHPGIPRSGTLSLTGREVDLALVHPWLPPGIHVEGRLQLDLTGRWQADAPPELEGRAWIDQGLARWREQEREIRVTLRRAELNGTWRDGRLQAGLELKLAEYGTVAGRLELPLAARWPLLVPETTRLQGRLDGTLREEGLLSALVPGLVQESRGLLELHLAVGGTRGQPRLSGTFGLRDAGGFLPATGILLQKVELQASLAGNRVQISRLMATSGKGSLEGKGEILFDGLALRTLRLHLTGENFSAVDLPELELAVSPDLVLTGKGDTWRVTGTLEIPEALVRGRQGKAAVQSSDDLVVVDAETTGPVRALPQLSVEVAVRLGDHVLVKAEGIDARLEGQVRISGPDLESLTGKGRIEVAQGSYSAYGVRLDISRGAAVFAGGPVEDPTLDLLASRTVGEVQAGVRVTGTPREPVVQLYSEPAMSDTDVLAYMVLGHPLGADSGQAGLLMAAAGTLLSQGESVVLQDRLKRELGLDVIDVQAGNGDVSQSLVTVGKYLSPRLYVSFGQSVFTNTSQVGLRYQIGHHWQVESTMGTESGVDLYYRITFE